MKTETLPFVPSCLAISFAILALTNSVLAEDRAGHEPGRATHEVAADVSRRTLSPENLAPTNAGGHANAQPAKAVTPCPPWVRIEGRSLMAGDQAVHLRGIGLGNWMLVEHFMIGLPQVDYVMRETFTEILGPEKSAAFWDAYMDNYFTEKDVARIKDLGFDHVRLPFSYRHFESDAHPGQWREEGFRLLDRMIGWCRQHGLWVLLDLHSAPGCQAADWNAESAHGEIFLGDNALDQERVAALWRQIRRLYHDEPNVLPYEVL